MNRDSFVCETKLMLLKLRHKETPKVEPIEDVILDNYELFYGVKLVKAKKRYQQYKQIKEKLKSIENQKEEEQE